MAVKKEYYSARCIFQFTHKNSDKYKYNYEERVVLLRANSFDKAIAQAVDEADLYADSNEGLYSGLINVYRLYDPVRFKIQRIFEVYSSMRKSNLEMDEYLDRYFDTGDECTLS